MSDVLADAIAKLKNDDDVAAIVGGRIYPGIAPQSAEKPYLVYVFSESALNCASGPTGTYHGTLHFSMIASGSPSGYAQLRSLVAAIETCIGGKNNGGPVWLPKDATDNPGALLAGQDVMEFQGVEQDYSVWYAR